MRFLDDVLGRMPDRSLSTAGPLSLSLFGLGFSGTPAGRHEA
jgi:hypothetical protein